jgi:type II secretion system protein C
MARERKKRKKSTVITPELINRIVAKALEHPGFGAQRLASLLKDDGVVLSKGSVYQVLRHKGLQTRDLRKQFLEKQHGLQESASCFETQAPPVPLQPVLQEQYPALPKSSIPEPIRPGTSSSMPDVLLFRQGEQREALVRAATGPILASLDTLSSHRTDNSIARKSGWIFHAINLLLVCLIVFFVANIGITIYDARQEPIAETTFSTPGQGSPVFQDVRTAKPIIPFIQYHKIVDRNLFGTATTSSKDSKQEDTGIEKIKLAGDEMGLKLIGTAVSKDWRMNHAVIEVAKTRAQEIYRERELAGNALIKRILRNNVIIVTDRGERRLTIDEEDIKRPPSAQTVTGLPTPTGSKMQNSTSNISIAHEVVAERLVNYEQLMKEVNISPEHPGIEGLRLGAVTANSPLTRFGLRTGDVIKELNDEEITGPDDAETFFQTLAGGGKVTIVVERRGRLQKLNLSIN